MTSAGGAGRRPRSSRASARLRRLIEEALVDAYGEDEEHGACPTGAEWFDAYRAWLKGAW